MRTIFLRFMQTFNSVHLQNQSHAINHMPKISNAPPKRYYKNFGHAEEPEPLSKKLMFGLGLFIMAFGSWRYLHESCDLFEEGEDRYKPEEEKMYQVPVHIRD